MNDIICAAFSSDGRSARTASIWQYDRGRMLQLTGLELPASYEVQFANCPQATTKRVVVYDTDTIVIPEEFTQLGEPVYVYIYNNSDKYGLTERLAIVPVKKRGPLSDEEPDPDQVDTIGSLIGALNGAVEQTAQDVADTTAAKEAAEAAAEAAENYSNIAGQHAQDASASKDAAQIAQTGAETAKADAETAAASASASATDAILLKNQAELAAQNAKQSEDVAVQARQDAIGLKNQAELAAQNASGYADTARMEREGAEAARDQAGQYAEDARAYAADAEEIKTATEAARDDAIMATSHSPKIENGTWWVWNQQTNAYVDTGVEVQGPQGDAYNLTEDDKAEIATLVDNMKIHICSASEYDSATDIPTIAEPDRNYFYLVPGGEGDNLYIEWVYLNDKWEQFGSATIDLSNYVQFDDYAAADKAGVVRVDQSSGSGIAITKDGVIVVVPASNNQIKLSTGYNGIPPSRQHASAFYGLAKAAGDTTQSKSTNAVGAYTDEAKAAIRNMIGAPSLEDIPEAPVQDVQVAGTSVVSDGVANIPKANSSTFGVVKTDSTYGIGRTGTGALTVLNASQAEIKDGASMYRALTPIGQHESTFYGLAKAAGADEKDSTLPVGQYTDTAKTAIRNMIGATSENVVAVQDEEPSDPDTKIWIPETAGTVEIPTMEDLETIGVPPGGLTGQMLAKKTDSDYDTEWIDFGSAGIATLEEIAEIINEYKNKDGDDDSMLVTTEYTEINGTSSYLTEMTAEEIANAYTSGKSVIVQLLTNDSVQQMYGLDSDIYLQLIAYEPGSGVFELPTVPTEEKLTMPRFEFYTDHNSSTPSTSVDFIEDNTLYDGKIAFIVRAQAQ